MLQQMISKKQTDRDVTVAKRQSKEEVNSRYGGFKSKGARRKTCQTVRTMQREQKRQDGQHGVQITDKSSGIHGLEYMVKTPSMENIHFEKPQSWNREPNRIHDNKPKIQGCNSTGETYPGEEASKRKGLTEKKKKSEAMVITKNNIHIEGRLLKQVEQFDHQSMITCDGRSEKENKV